MEILQTPGMYIIDLFQTAVRKLRRENPVEAERLGGNLLEWASVVSGGEELTLAQVLERQIVFAIERVRGTGKQTTPQEYIDGLFSKNPKGELTADIIMGRLQLG